MMRVKPPARGFLNVVEHVEGRIFKASMIDCEDECCRWWLFTDQGGARNPGFAGSASGPKTTTSCATSGG
eukprot:1036749-Pyramimonas_sp.AAC.1